MLLRRKTPLTLTYIYTERTEKYTATEADVLEFLLSKKTMKHDSHTKL
jgi:hypothetical protein